MKRLGFDPKESFLLTRILRGIEHFSVRKNHTETADMLKSQSEIDATMVDSSYVLIKVFIWAIPILGLLAQSLVLVRLCPASEVRWELLQILRKLRNSSDK